MANFPGANKLRRTPPPSPKLAPQRSGRSPSPAESEEIVQTLTAGSNEFPVTIPMENTTTEEMNSTQEQETGPQASLMYDRGGMLRPYLPVSNRQGQVGRPIIAGEEKQRQEWLRWISWIWEARRQGVEAQLPAIIGNCKINLDQNIREYDVELSRMIFRVVMAEAVKRMPTEQEMLQGIREGFILAMQLGDTKQMLLEVRDLHQKGGDKRVSPLLKAGVEGGVISPREFTLDQVVRREEPPSKELHQLRLERVAPMPKQSRYFTPEQSENESEIKTISKQMSRMPRDIPKDPVQQLQKKVQKVVQETNLGIEAEGSSKLTKKILEQVEKRYEEKKEKPTKARGQDPSPSPSSSSTSADERRRRARREKEKETDKKKQRDASKRRKRASDRDDDPSDPSSGSSDDSDSGNKKYRKKQSESSSEESERSERATRQQRKDFMAILKANAPKKYRGDRDPKVLREWVNQVDHYMSMVKLTKRDEMRTILLLFEGDAMLWWRRNRKEFKKKGISSWKAIKRLIVDRFMPLGYRLMLEKQLREVCQRTSAREYASRFTHIIMQLPDYTDKQIISHFINGLKTSVRTQVISHDPTELEEAIRLAENVDDGVFAEQIAARKSGVPDLRVTRVTSYKVNQIEGAKKGAPPNGERKFPASIKCYNCGKLGHIS